jgi:hypothetical protein
MDGLEFFKHIGFVSSYQDKYAPYESARVQVEAKAKKNTKGRIFLEMANNILSRINTDRLLRIDVNFMFHKKIFDRVIGRAAHIQMLDNTVLLNMILYCCNHFFEY